MIPFRVKVCGVTRPEDAAVAVRYGADMIGMIFAKSSPRFVTEDTVEQILPMIPPVVFRVGVFVNDPIDEVLLTGARFGLDFLQLHGPYSDEDVRRARRGGFRVIRLHLIKSEEDYRDLYVDPADLVLLDNGNAAQPGGTGVQFDWSLRPPSPVVNLMLAGGITAENVAEGLGIFEPLVVDVNSGVEAEPGMKSLDKLKHFFEVCNTLRYGRCS